MRQPFLTVRFLPSLQRKDEATGEVMDLAIQMFCDRCGTRVAENVNGAVRVKIGAAEYVFHLCLQCQQLFDEGLVEYHRGKVSPKKGVSSR